MIRMLYTRTIAMHRRNCAFILLLAACAPISGTAETMLPDGERVAGTRQISEAWLIQPTGRYRHGILGDTIEAGGLSLILRDGSARELRRVQHQRPISSAIHLLPAQNGGRAQLSYRLDNGENVLLDLR